MSIHCFVLEFVRTVLSKQVTRGRVVSVSERSREALPHMEYVSEEHEKLVAIYLFIASILCYACRVNSSFSKNRTINKFQERNREHLFGDIVLHVHQTLF